MMQHAEKKEAQAGECAGIAVNDRRRQVSALSKRSPRRNRRTCVDDAGLQVEMREPKSDGLQRETTTGASFAGEFRYEEVNAGRNRRSVSTSSVSYVNLKQATQDRPR